MMAPILGRADQRADAFAIDLGIAMQLTNIARDVAEDAIMGRRYIPANWCETLTSAEISAGIASPETKIRAIISAGIVKILDLSESYYRSGLSGLAYLPWQNHLAIGIAAKVYRAIGIKIVRRNYEWWRGRQVTNAPEKLIASAESLPLLISRRKKPDFHDFDLHSPLKDIKSVIELRRGT
jgi:phytoene synthase